MLGGSENRTKHCLLNLLLETCMHVNSWKTRAKKLLLLSLKATAMLFFMKVWNPTINDSLRGNVKHELRVTKSCIPVTSSNLQVTSSSTRVSDSNPRIASSNPRVTSSNSRVSSSNSPVKRLKTRVGRLKAWIKK